MVTVKILKCISALKESCKNKHSLKILEILEIMEITRSLDFKITIGHYNMNHNKKKKSIT
jgi:hypothetical protein